MHAPNDYALVIGINDYPQWDGGKYSLKSPNQDALEFYQWLVDAEGGGLHPEHAHLVQSAADPLSPYQFEIDRTFAKIRNQSLNKERRRFYFYFSGHGHSPGTSFDQQCLCLPNWSPDAPGAALDLKSYIKAAVGCLNFSESIFFLDCCRVRTIAPLGKVSDLECGNPTTTDRHYAIVYSSDHHKASLEGEIRQQAAAAEQPDAAEGDDPTAAGDGDKLIRSYFTVALLNILKKETIELVPLVRRLKVDVAALAKQTVRALPTDKEIILGPPNRKPPPAEQIPQVYKTRTTRGLKARVERKLVDETYTLKVEVRSDLKLQSPGEHKAVLMPGEIVVFRGTTFMSRERGHFQKKLPVGNYQIHVVHGDVSEGHELRLSTNTSVAYALPNRFSAAPLASTTGRRDDLDAVIAASKWKVADQAGVAQAVFINLYQGHARQDRGDALQGRLCLNIDGLRRTDVELGNTLVPVPANATVELVHHDLNGRATFLPVPVAMGWDTQIFIALGGQGIPMLSAASISMRVAGAGFDPSDGLIDAYELALADLATEGPGPDEGVLHALLKGDYRNPLYRLVGAHFLVRKLSTSQTPSREDLQLLDTVIEDLTAIMGPGSPDLAALRLVRARWADAEFAIDAEYSLRANTPLLKPGLDAFVQATSWLERANFNGLADIVLGLDPNSNWTCWSRQPPPYSLSSSHGPEGQSVRLSFSPTEATRIDLIELTWRNAGYATTRFSADGRSILQGDRVGPEDDVLQKTWNLLRIPDWLVAYVRETEQQSMRTGFAPTLPSMVLRTGMPADLILQARALTKWLPAVKEDANGQRAGEAFAGHQGAA
ncbi:hypothetical protein FDV58_17865 [Bradyrhizobium elkanii]|uniref:Peptidase C14 caspase domain-containing protein n=1 Tax=Bradyrhizobium elkanii TaxID=29448 RepID=A0A4U6S609_BRAEL|nr:caspase family protein [Bradyrhizobium elkanii]TKV80116.1 hypothetical protein FDV58_17865 [Bradyrhizobium elkanii]